MVEFGARIKLNDGMSATLMKNIQQMRTFQEQVESTRQALDAYTNAKYSVNVDDGEAKGKLDAMAQHIMSLHDQNLEFQIAANDEAAQQKVADIKAKMEELKSRIVEPVVNLKDQISQRLDPIKQKLELLRNRVVSPVVTLADRATVGLNKIKSTFNAVKSQFVSPLVARIKDEVSSKVGAIKSKLSAIKNTIVTPIIRAKDAASNVIQKVKDKFNQIKEGVKSRIGLQDNATPGLNGISSLLKKLAVGTIITVGIKKVGDFVGAAVSEGAALEQSLGGVETLFKEHADIVKKNADLAYKTAGVSANAYMENVTSFSASLLNSLQGDTAKAASVADMAMIDMSDNANKFGTDIGSIQNAYQGFAKQNYTMLDNLNTMGALAA